MNTCLKHPNRKTKREGMCSQCYETWRRENEPEFRKKKNNYASNWQKINKEKRIEYNKKRKEYYNRNEKSSEEYKLKRRNQLLMRKYGIDHDDYLKQLEFQGNKCFICHKSNTPGKYFHVDHCHKTGNIRGVLCHQCNWYLGLIDNDTKILTRLNNYINNYEQVHPEIRGKNASKS